MTNKAYTPSVSFSNLRWSVDENTRLSISYWGDTYGMTYAVALFRLMGGKWVIDHSTAQEFRGKFGKNAEDAEYRSTDYGYKMAKAILGDKTPERFFRDNVISK